MKIIILVLLLLTVGSFSYAAKTDDDANFGTVKLTQEEEDSFKVPPQKIPIPKWMTMTGAEIKKVKVAAIAADTSREPTQARGFAAQFDNDEKYVAFRREYLACRDGYSLYNVIKKYDDQYETLSDNMKFVMIRLATMMPLRGFIWRTVPVIHNTLIAQEMLLSQVKNLGENLLIHEPDSHVQAQLAFFSMPFGDQVEQKTIPKRFGSKQVFTKRFYAEGDLITFMATDLYDALGVAIGRLERLQKERKGDIVFDAQIRFGEHAFTTKKHDDHDRYRVIGDAEIWAQAARYHRRMTGIAQMAAYNWNGYIALSKEIGGMYGMDVQKSKLFDVIGEEFYIDGVDREERVAVTKRKTNLYVLTANGKGWMFKAYEHLVANAAALKKSWEAIRDDRTPDEFALLDTDVLMGRKDQMQRGVDNMNRIVNG
ncbi:MAG: hypothetical protein ABL958_19525, partial [Bdellovibrionia bacterium]